MYVYIYLLPRWVSWGCRTWPWKGLKWQQLRSTPPSSYQQHSQVLFLCFGMQMAWCLCSFIYSEIVSVNDTLMNAGISQSEELISLLDPTIHQNSKCGPIQLAKEIYKGIYIILYLARLDPWNWIHSNDYNFGID